MFVGLTQFLSRYHLCPITIKACFLSCWWSLFLLFLLLFPKAPTLLEPFSGILILRKWYPHLDICFQCSLSWGISPDFTDDSVLKHQENFPLRWIWYWRFIFSLVNFIVGQFGLACCWFCWFLSSCNQAKMHMSNSMLSFSLKRSSLFSIMLQDGKRVVSLF